MVLYAAVDEQLGITQARGADCTIWVLIEVEDRNFSIGLCVYIGVL